MVGGGVWGVGLLLTVCSHPGSRGFHHKVWPGATSHIGIGSLGPCSSLSLLVHTSPDTLYTSNSVPQAQAAIAWTATLCPFPLLCLSRSYGPSEYSSFNKGACCLCPTAEAVGNHVHLNSGSCCSVFLPTQAGYRRLWMSLVHFINLKACSH